MNTTFEDQLREDLRAAAGHAAYGSVDPVHVIAEGTRLVRHRRRRQGIGATATAVLLAVGGFVATDHGRTTTAPPAGPTTAVASARGSVTFTEMSTNLNGVEVTGPARLRVSLDDSGTVTYTFEDGKGGSTSAGSSISPAGGGVTWGSGGGYPNLVVGVAPAPATHLTDIGSRGSTGGSTSDQKPLPGTRYQAFVRLYSDADAVSKLRGFIWVDGSGAVRTSDPAVEAFSAGFAGLGREPSRLAVVPDWDWLGVFDDEGASSVWISEAEGSFGNEVPRVEMGKLDGSSTRVTAAGILPGDASRITPSYASGAGTHPVQTAPLRRPDGSPGPYTGFFTEFRDHEPQRAPRPWLTSIAWTDAIGQRHQSTLR